MEKNSVATPLESILSGGPLRDLTHLCVDGSGDLTHL